MYLKQTLNEGEGRVAKFKKIKQFQKRPNPEN